MSRDLVDLVVAGNAIYQQQKLNGAARELRDAKASHRSLVINRAKSLTGVDIDGLRAHFSNGHISQREIDQSRRILDLVGNRGGDVGKIVREFVDSEEAVFAAQEKVDQATLNLAGALPSEPVYVPVPIDIDRLRRRHEYHRRDYAPGFELSVPRREFRAEERRFRERDTSVTNDWRGNPIAATPAGTTAADRFRERRQQQLERQVEETIRRNR